MCTAFDFGNKCGHVKHSPRLFTRPEHHQKRPILLEDAIAALDSFYYQPLLYLKRLIRVVPPVGRFESQKERFKRSERREAIKLIAETILYYLDLESFTLGYKTPNGWWLPNLEWIAKVAGVTLQRAKRALFDLAKSGYIKITRRRLRKGKSIYRSLPSIRQIRPIFFFDLGISNKRLRKAQENKQKYEVKKFNDQIREEVQKGNSPFKALIESIPKIKTETRVNATHNTPIKNTYANLEKAEHEKARIDKAMYLHQQDPSKPFSYYYRKLKQAEDSS